MRIYELNGRNETQKAGHRVAVLGSAQMLDAFEALVRQGRANRLWSDGALTHSLPEVAQLIAYTRGRTSISRDMRPFVFEPDEKPERTAEDRSILDSVGTFFVEMSEARYVGCAPYALNVDGFVDRFVSKQGLSGWYRALASKAVDKKTIDAAMAGLADRSAEEKAWIKSLLRRSKLVRVTDAKAMALLNEIVFDPAKQWILVSPPSESAAGGATASERAKTIEQVRKIGAKKKLPVATADGGADGLLKAAGLVAEAKEDTAAIAARINDSLVKLHEERLSALGPDESGLYAHYERLLDSKAIVGRDIVTIVERVLDELPEFDQYHVLRAGLGEFGFLVSALGLPTVAVDPDLRRFGAMQAGLDSLGHEYPVIARCLTMQNRVLPSPPFEGRVLAFATHFIGCPPKDEDKVLDQLESYAALLIRPNIFMFPRASESEQAALMAKLAARGFTEVKPITREVLCVVQPWKEQKAGMSTATGGPST